MRFILLLFIAFPLFAEELNLENNNKKRVLTILTWESFFPEEVLNSFSEKHNVKIETLNYYTEEMKHYIVNNQNMRKVDIVIGSKSSMIDYVEDDLLAPLNYERLTNYKYIDKSHVYNRSLKLHTVAISYGILGIAYRTDKSFTPPKTWSDFINPEEQLKNKMTLIDDAEDTMEIFLLGNGYSIKDYSFLDLRKSAESFNNFLPYIQDFYYHIAVEDDPLITGEVWMAPAYGFEFQNMKKLDPTLEIVFPKNTKIWFDLISVLRNSEDKDLAFDFINHIMNPKVAAKTQEHNYYNSFNIESYSYLSEELKNNQYIFPTINNIYFSSDDNKDDYIFGKKLFYFDRLKNKFYGELKNEATK